MPIVIAQTLVAVLLAYGALGLLFALAFVFKGVGRIDPDAIEGSWGFKVLILPGAAAFWPLLLVRWIRSSPPPTESSPHRRAAGRKA